MAQVCILKFKCMDRHILQSRNLHFFVKNECVMYSLLICCKIIMFSMSSAAIYINLRGGLRDYFSIYLLFKKNGRLILQFQPMSYYLCLVLGVPNCMLRR